MKSRLVSLLGLAVAAAMFVTCLPSKAEANIQPVNTYDGWTGTKGGMLCLDRNCDSDQTGCSWTVHQYDQYWTQYRCRDAETDAGEIGEDCTQTLKKCRETKTYSGTDVGACTGTITQWSINWYGAC